MKDRDRVRFVRIWVVAVVLLLTGLAWPSIAAAEQGFTVEEVLASPFPSFLTAAKNNQRVAWVFTLRGVANLWVAEGPRFEGRQLTSFSVDDGRPLRVLGFSPDGEWVFFAKSSRFNPDHSPLGSGPSKLYRIAWAGGAAEELAEADSAAVSPAEAKLAFVNEEKELWIVEPGKGAVKVVEARGKLSEPSWSPDGTKVLMSCLRGEFPHRYSFITVYDLEHDAMRYLDASVYLDLKPVWSPDGTRVAFLRRLRGGHAFSLLVKTVGTPDPWEIRVADVSTGKTARAWRSPDSDSFYFADLAWMDDEHVVFRSERDGWRHLYLVGADGSGVKQLTSGEYEVEDFHPDHERGRVFMTCNRDDVDRRHIWSVDADGTMVQVTGGASIEWSPVPLAAGENLFFVASDARHPAHVYVKSIGAEQAKKLAPEALPETFPSDRLVEPRAVVFDSADGVSIHGQLFMPPARYQGRRPALMFFHGGPIRQMLLGFHYRGYYHRSYAINQYLASRGYVVLSVNYRLGIGYGRAFRDVPDGGPRGGSEYRDLLAAAKLLRRNPRVDPDRIGLWGGSYGGLMTALGLARNSDLFAAGVDLHGVHDWNQWQAWVTGQENDEGRPEWKSSPVADLESWTSPVLLIHGDDDRNVPFSETKWLAERLDEMGVDHEVLVFPDDVHGFLLHRNWVCAYEAMADFFDRKLGIKGRSDGPTVAD
jgi:dipeptidyl aminopeptidase/acylaminoacyl peptidase